MAKFEQTLVTQCAQPVRPTQRVPLPSISVFREHFVARQPMHDAQLNDVQLMIKRAGNHW
jgi:hypothetical protein